MIESGAKKKKETRITEIQSRFEDPAASKEVVVWEAASTIALCVPKMSSKQSHLRADVSFVYARGMPSINIMERRTPIKSF